MLLCIVFVFFFFKQKTAYEMRISDWSSDVCSSDLNIAFGYLRLKALPVMASKQTFGCVDTVIATSPMLERLNLCAGPSDMDLPRTPSFRLDGRRALVTGAGRGIGLALAAALAQAGAEVTLAARSGEEIEAAAIAIQKAGGAATTAVLDVTDLAAVHSFFAERPAFHILVNNAGTNRPMTTQQASEAAHEAVLALNQKAAFFLPQQSEEHTSELKSLM